MLIRGCLPARDAAAAKDEAEVATATAAVDKLSRPSTLHFGGLALTLYLAQLQHVCPSLSPLVWRLVCSLPTCLVFDLLPPPCFPHLLLFVSAVCSLRFPAAAAGRQAGSIVKHHYRSKPSAVAEQTIN